MKTKFDTRSMVLLGLLAAVVAVLSLTPIGTIPIGPLSITLNVIPIAIAAVALGPVGGLIIGGVFGLFSFLQCFGIGVLSGMGAATFEISPVLTFVQRFVTRALDGLLVGLIFFGLSKIRKTKILYIITGIVAGAFGIALFLSVMLLVCYEKGQKYNMSPDMYRLMNSGKLIAYIVIAVFALGFTVGYLVVSGKKLSRLQVACAISGFSAAIINTIFFMSALVLFFGSSEYLKELIAGRNVVLYIVVSVGINALFEMVIATIFTTIIGGALFKAKLIKTPEALKEEA